MNMENKMGKPKLYSLLVAGTMGTMVAGGILFGATTASAAADCAIGPGVTQTDTAVFGSSGNDTIDCSSSNPGKTIYGNDTITGTTSNDTIWGGVGNDTLTGGTGDDQLYGELGADTLNGSAGNDQLYGPGIDLSQDTLNGGTGTDNCFSPPEDLVNTCE
jgi:Ca2+-binding RTX toxin-like protein